MAITLNDLLSMSQAERDVTFRAGHPVDPSALAGWNYTGVDLSLPRWMNKVLWKTFRKTFVQDADHGLVRGWNVRMRQTGWERDQEPLRDRHGRPKTFGHYLLRPADGMRFPRGWDPAGHTVLDYGSAGNLRRDLAAYTASPIVAVNAGDMDLLLGWEVIRVGPKLVGLPDWWALVRQSPITADEIIPPPRPDAVRA
ncbi:MAG: hypothetical protein D6761_08055 [Candidatus Dadabacteria bacterium]|nr:MAG: hypothetical protein D6761_08055 [Candidatus Dadabacteria bacterium]